MLLPEISKEAKLNLYRADVRQETQLETLGHAKNVGWTILPLSTSILEVGFRGDIATIAVGFRLTWREKQIPLYIKLMAREAETRFGLKL